VFGRRQLGGRVAWSSHSGGDPDLMCDSQDAFDGLML